MMLVWRRADRVHEYRCVEIAAQIPAAQRRLQTTREYCRQFVVRTALTYPLPAAAYRMHTPESPISAPLLPDLCRVFLRLARAARAQYTDSMNESFARLQ